MENKHENKVIWNYYQTKLREVFNRNNARYDYLFNIIKKIKLKNPKILELGFGDGYLLNKLLSYYRKNIYGADICKNNIDHIKYKLDKIDFGIIEYGLTNLDEKFDIVIASEVLEHMTDKELINCIIDIYNKLNNYGYFIITVPYNEDFNNNKCICPNCNNIFHKWGHKQSWNENKIKNIFKKYKIISIKRKFFNSSNNLLGNLATNLRNILYKYYRITGGNYVIILQKSDITEEYYRLREKRFKEV